jgi:uncharacterized integral membrane protein (TIGR02327 family)
MSVFILRMLVEIGCFALSFYAVGALNYEKLLKPGHVVQAQLLYWLLVLALSWLVSQFLFSLMYPLQ